MKLISRGNRCRMSSIATLAVALSSTLIPSPSRACTSLVLDASTPIFATNYDNVNHLALLFVNPRGQQKSGLSASTNGAVLHWRSTYASISFNVGGYQLPWAGVNEAGLMLSTMQLAESAAPTADARPPLDYGPLWMQYVLDTCATVDEVIATTRRVRILDPEDHYLVADRHGGRAVIEFLADDTIVHTGSSLPVAVLTDNGYESSLAVWSQLHQQGSTDYSHLESPLRRFCLAADYLDDLQPTPGEAAVADAFAALASTADPITQFSIVFDPAASRAYFKTADEPFIRHVGLGGFNLGCQAQVQMLDIHTGAAGSVDHLFSELSIPMCIDHMEGYFDLLGEVVPAGAVEAYHNVVAGFGCAAHRRSSGRLHPGPG